MSQVITKRPEEPPGELKEKQQEALVIELVLELIEELSER